MSQVTPGRSHDRVNPDRNLDQNLDILREHFARRLIALSPRLINTARKKHKLSLHDAEEAIQETWVRCERNINKLPHVINVDSWLTKTFYFSCKTTRAAQMRSRLDVLSELEDELRTDGKNRLTLDTMLFSRGQHIGPRTSADYHIEGSNDLLRDAIKSLTPKERRATLLRGYMKEEYDTIASILGCSLSTVRTFVSVGFSKVRKFIEQNRQLYD